MSQRNQNPQRQYRDNEESALSSLRELVAQLTRREPNTPCDTLEEALRLIRDLPYENERMKQQLANLAMARRGPGEPSSRVGYAPGQQSSGQWRRDQPPPNYYSRQ